MPRITPYILFLGILLTACTKKETIYHTDHQNVVINDNEPPPYDGVTTLQIQSYINRIYIDLLGREPLPAELAADTDELKAGELTIQARKDLLEKIMDSDEYYDRYWEISSDRIIPGLTDQQLDDDLIAFQFVYESYLLNGDTLLAQLLQPEITKLEELNDAKADLATGQIDLSEFMDRLAYNLYFDEINMGSENFVLACFEHFFKRYPTNDELQNGVTMVDGFPTQLLFRDGNSKIDFLDIITHDIEFYQGLVIDIYQQLLARIPSSQEMGEAAQQLSLEKNYKAIQRQVMADTEYTGF